MSETIVTLKKGEGRTLKAGGMWVFDNEIESITGRFENGSIVTVHDFEAIRWEEASLIRIPGSASV